MDRFMTWESVTVAVARPMLPLVVRFCIFCLLSGRQEAQAISDIAKRGWSKVFTVEQLSVEIDVTSVIWIHNGNIAAEWEEGVEKPIYYGIFNSKTTLDMNTWALTISSLQPDFSGDYSVDINYKGPTNLLTLIVVDADPVYGVKGQSVTLQAKAQNVQGQIAQWTLNNTVIADRDEETHQTAYKNMKFDNETLSLTISDLLANYSGLYAFKLNNINKGIYQLIVRDAMLELRITKHCNSTSCTLNCTGVNDENTQVSWTDNKGGKMSGPVWVLERSPHLDVIYNCSSDSGSWKTESVSETDYSISGNTESNWEKIQGPVVAVLVLLAFGVGVGVVLYKKRRARNTRRLHPQDQQPQQQNGFELLPNNVHQEEEEEEKEECPLNGGTEGNPKEHSIPSIWKSSIICPLPRAKEEQPHLRQ
ncbi:uncharacterized protein LOC134078713 isoform X2 [Sardina pilchardus]|uniref:uncharacterized protein LOC134078713 isoform X2 n=1 Tax=Sardina pilchardus TaxID=27697 RepID=UPI002E106F46